MWNEIIINKNTPQLNQWGLKTPPTINFPLIQPLAPIKSRKAINKTDLKPKKLIFKEEIEPDIIDDNYMKIINEKREEIRVRGQRRKHNVNDDKENCIELMMRFKNNKEINSVSGNKIKATSSDSYLTNQNNFKVKNGLKHLRI